MGKRELVALLNLSTWCLVMVERLFLAVLWGGLQFVIVVFLYHTHLLFLNVRTKFLRNNACKYTVPVVCYNIIVLNGVVLTRYSSGIFYFRNYVSLQTPFKHDNHRHSLI